MSVQKIIFISSLLLLGPLAHARLMLETKDRKNNVLDYGRVTGIFPLSTHGDISVKGVDIKSGKVFFCNIDTDAAASFSYEIPQLRDFLMISAQSADGSIVLTCLGPGYEPGHVPNNYIFSAISISIQYIE